MTLTDKLALWERINRYVVACGGDPASRVYGNTSRMQAVTDVEELVDRIAKDAGRAAVNACLDEALNSGNGSYRP